MTTLIKTLAAFAVGTTLATGAFAQTAKGLPDTSPLAPIENEAAPKLIVGTPLPGPLSRGVAVIPYRLENFRILPVTGAEALKVSPRVGHLHVTLNDLPWHWADFSDSQSIVVAPLPPGQHTIRVELADPTHRVLVSQTVTFTVPGPSK